MGGADARRMGKTRSTPPAGRVCVAVHRGLARGVADSRRERGCTLIERFDARDIPPRGRPQLGSCDAHSVVPDNIDRIGVVFNR